MILILIVILNIITIIQSSQVISAINNAKKIDDVSSLKFWNIIYLCVSILSLLICFGLLYVWYGTATGRAVNSADQKFANIIDNYSDQLPNYSGGQMQNYSGQQPFYPTQTSSYY